MDGALMESKVSGLLHEALSPEAQAAIFLPWIEQSIQCDLIDPVTNARKAK
jgi:hypothetical protein